MERRKVVAGKALRTFPLRSWWWAWALWISAKVWDMPGWVVGALGAVIALICLGAVVAALHEDECEPVWKDEVTR